ncbi:MAG TPA: ribonuclease M5 [Bacillota bacterium]|jgi:ribonuclease M5|nr:ribonuclease M5 [Bacillota bacterium]
MKPQIKQIIIVEGRDDESAVKAAVDAHIIVTNGFSIGRKTWDLIEKAYQGPGILIFTDPDFAGENIRKRIKERFPESCHAYLPKEDAKKGEDIGIENASAENIIRALQKAMSTPFKPKDLFTVGDLLFFGLAGTREAGKRRELMGRTLGIGSCNAKAFLSRLNGYSISKEEFYRNGQALFKGDGPPVDK